MSFWNILKKGLASLGKAFLCFILAKKVKENEILRKQNQKMQKQMQISTRPDVSWDTLLEWLRQQ